MHTRHKSGHLETIYLAYITYTLWTVLYSSYMYFCEFFIVITILLLFGFASSLPSSPKRARQDDSKNLGISNFFICQPKSVHQTLTTAIFLFFLHVFSNKNIDFKSIFVLQSRNTHFQESKFKIFQWSITVFVVIQICPKNVKQSYTQCGPAE